MRARHSLIDDTAGAAATTFLFSVLRPSAARPLWRKAQLARPVLRRAESIGPA